MTAKEPVVLYLMVLYVLEYVGTANCIYEYMNHLM